MGNSYDGEEKGMEAMKYIPEVAREYINHHIGNSLTSLNACLFIKNIEGAQEAVDHIIGDLKDVGFFQLSKKEKEVQININIKQDYIISPEMAKDIAEDIIKNEVIPDI